MLTWTVTSLGFLFLIHSSTILFLTESKTLSCSSTTSGQIQISALQFSIHLFVPSSSVTTFKQLENAASANRLSHLAVISAVHSGRSSGGLSSPMTASSGLQMKEFAASNSHCDRPYAPSLSLVSVHGVPSLNVQSSVERQLRLPQTP